MLHHLGEATRGDAKEAEEEVKAYGGKCVVVEGDVSDPETGKKVSCVSNLACPTTPSQCSPTIAKIR